jgi:GLPGLI family protein
MYLKKYLIPLFFLLILINLKVFSQQVINEGVLIYNISIQTGSAEPKMADMLDGATTTIYLKGSQTKSEMLSGLGKESTIYDSRTGTGVILKDYSGQKLMITLDKADWEKKNHKYEGITYAISDEIVSIAGYDCKKAIATLKDGNSFTVYFAPGIKVSNLNYDNPFKNLPGLAVQYEWKSGKMMFKYTLAKISNEAIPSSRFEIPKSGYRVLTFEETQKAK